MLTLHVEAWILGDVVKQIGFRVHLAKMEDFSNTFRTEYEEFA